MSSRERVIEILKEAGVLLEGHFILTSGKHSDKYLQCAKIFRNTRYSEELCRSLAEQFADDRVDVVIGPATVSYTHLAPSTVLLLELGRTVGGCPGSCKCHQKLMENLLEVLAQKNLLLNRRLGHLCRRTTRDKQLSFLHEQAAAAGSNAFAIPFDRQQMADYLCVERSAMSAALSRLREEGLISYRRNRFWLTGK